MKYQNRTKVAAALMKLSDNVLDMKLDMILSENWEQLNDSLKEKWAVHAPFQLRTFKDLSSAVLEIAQGTAQFLSHKKSVGFIKGQTPAYDFILPHFYKEAYQVTHTVYRDIVEVKAWVEGLSKDTSFVLYAEDHPITGEVYPFCDEMDRCLNEKRIFSIRISHARHFYEDLAIRPYSVRICSWAENLAVAILGERFKAPPIVAHRQPWHLQEINEVISQAQKSTGLLPQAASRQMILDFEKSLASVAQIWFKDTGLRLWDRSVVVFPDVSAEALAEKIFAHWRVLPEQGWQKIDTTNMCRWHSVEMYQSWWDPQPSAETLRGLLVFSREALQTKDFAKLVLSSYEELKQMQSWS